MPVVEFDDPRLGTPAVQQPHHQVIKVLYELYRESPSYSGAYPDHLDIPKKDIDLPLPGVRGQVYPYMPDFYAQLKSGLLDIVEVWAATTEDASIRDILFAALAPKVNSLTVVCYDDPTRVLAEKLGPVILGLLHSKKGKLFLNPKSKAQYRIVQIPDAIQGDEEKMSKYLAKELKIRPKR